MIDKVEMITQSGILLRNGWSKSVVVNLLGEPDLRKKIYGRSAPACLYCLDRVIAAESTPAFIDGKDILAKRKAAGVKAVKTKIDKLMSDIAKMSVVVQPVNPRRLQQMAIDAYNDWNVLRDPASANSDEMFLQRICVNFIRHNLTEYDQALWAIAGKTGKDLAVTAIRQKVFSAIATVYPKFKDECFRQMWKRDETE